MRTSSKIFGAAAAMLLLGGCQLLYMFVGKGHTPAVFTIPENSRVLVLIDPEPSSGMPPDVPATMGEMLNDHLYKYKAADNFVNQARLTEIRKDPRFDKRELGIADIARATDADIVLWVRIITFSTTVTGGGQLNEGYAEALIKAVNRDGKRLFPEETEVLGFAVQARVAPVLAEQTSMAKVKTELLDLLTMRTGRLFHEYDLEDKAMNR